MIVTSLQSWMIFNDDICSFHYLVLKLLLSFFLFPNFMRLGSVIEYNKKYFNRCISSWRSLIAIRLSSATGVMHGEYAERINDEWIVFLCSLSSLNMRASMKLAYASCLDFRSLNHWFWSLLASCKVCLWFLINWAYCSERSWTFIVKWWRRLSSLFAIGTWTSKDE